MDLYFVPPLVRHYPEYISQTLQAVHCRHSIRFTEQRLLSVSRIALSGRGDFVNCIEIQLQKISSQCSL